MSQIEDRVEALLDETKTVKLRSRWPFRIFIAVLLLSLAGGLGFFTLRPRTYTATAYMQILTQRPYFIYSEQERMQYDQYVQTQFAIIRSPLIVDKALEDPEVARLKTILHQRDKAGWLSKNLKLQRQADSEMVTISISTTRKDEPDKIVNAVVNAFFQYYATQSNEWNHKLIMQLNLEYNRQQAAVRLLQDEIRSAMEEAARQGGVAGSDGALGGFAHAELLLKEIIENESKLTSLRAELKMLRQLVEEGPKVPQSAVWQAIENDREIMDLFEQKLILQKDFESFKRILQEDDPKITNLENQLKELDITMDEKRKRLEEEKTRSLRMEMLESLESEIAVKDRGVRTTEILVKDLKEKYKEQLANVASRTTKIVDVSFQQAQLERYNGVLRLLQERITKLETERHAPEQIQLKKRAQPPDAPDRRWGW